MDRKKFFRPTKTKIIILLLLPIITILSFIGVGYISSTRSIVYGISIWCLYAIIILSIPLKPILIILGLYEYGWIDSPTITGAIVVSIIYAILLYLLISLISYIRNIQKNKKYNNDKS